MLDALNRKHQLKVVYVGETKFQKEVRFASCRDGLAKEIKQNIKKGIKSHFHLRNRVLWYKKNQLYVLKGRLRDVLVKECHDGPLVGHGGVKRTTTFLKKSYYWPNLKLTKHTTTFLKKSYYWPNLKDDAEEYVKTCLTYQ